jgi:hypothetical protein
MDYLELAAKGCIFLGGSMLIGVALYLARSWWLEREERRRLEANQHAEDDYYAGLHQALLRHVDEYAHLKESLLLHIEALLRKVDRQ